MVTINYKEFVSIIYIYIYIYIFANINYFTTLVQVVDMTNSYKILSRLTIYIIILLRNYPHHTHFTRVMWLFFFFEFNVIFQFEFIYY